MILIVFLCVLTIAFLSWSFAGGNTAKPVAINAIADAVLVVISYPLFRILPDDFVNAYFEFVFIVNALLWTAMVALIILRVGGKTSEKTGQARIDS